MTRLIARAALCLASLALLGTGGLVVAADQAVAAPPSLTASAVFGQASYASGDTVSVQLSVHNAGTTAAPGISVRDDSSPTELVPDNGFGALGDGVTIPAGGTVTVTVSGNLQVLTAAKVTFAGTVFDKQGDGVADFSINAPVTVRTATVNGVVYDDANANGRADSGEGISGLTLQLNYAFADKQYAVRTGTDGRFSIVVPTASYYADGKGSGLQVIEEQVTVGVDGADLTLRAVRPLGKVLTAELHFTRHTYAPGDTAHIVITLTNTSSTTLRGIGAECDHAGEPNELNNYGPGWGDLSNTGAGVTLLPHQPRTFEETGTVPAAAQRAGQVVLACDFGYRAIDDGYRPVANDTAKVPGLSGAVDGFVQYYPRGHGGAAVGIAKVRILLVNPTTCPAFTRTATTNSAGFFRIAGAPAGSSYQLYVYPPTGWKVVGGNPTSAFVFGNDTIHLDLEVTHGSAPLPPVSTRCAAPTPPRSSTPVTRAPRPPRPPAATSSAPLADTGADQTVPAYVGGAAVLIGALFLLLGRRRRSH